MTKEDDISPEIRQQAMQRLNIGFPSDEDLLFLAEQGFEFRGTPFQDQYMKALKDNEVSSKPTESEKRKIHLGTYTNTDEEKKAANRVTELRGKELLGKDFLGVEAIRKMENELRKVEVNVEFALDRLPPFPYTEEDLQTAKSFGEMLVLRPEAMLRGGRKVPLTLIEFRELFREDPLGKMQTVVFCFRTHAIDWCKGEKFATQPGEIKLSWSLVKKDVLDGSLNTNWNDQKQLLRQYEASLKRKGAKNASVRRRNATEAVYDELLYYVNTGERLLPDKFDWGQTRMHGSLAYVGSFDSDGLEVGYASSGWRTQTPVLGVCPSR